ncbi:KAP family P-loop domain-containing protein [Demequina mangrovi]|uniref:KAP family P-loop domain-containing protein n=2 Tax=Demequina mangrovi TaxID=1043493 RepID=A0A1H7B784_9MICO|nr:KAP family P-loop domain-containing protein [Demequina mangrovi]
MGVEIVVAAGKGVVAAIDETSLPQQIRGEEPVDLRGWMARGDGAIAELLVARLAEALDRAQDVDALGDILVRMGNRATATGSREVLGDSAPPGTDVRRSPSADELLVFARQVAGMRGHSAATPGDLLVAAIGRPFATRDREAARTSSVTAAPYAAIGRMSRESVAQALAGLGVELGRMRSGRPTDASLPTAHDLVDQAVDVCGAVGALEVDSRHVVAVAVRGADSDPAVAKVFGITPQDFRTALLEAWRNKPAGEDLDAVERMLAAPAAVEAEESDGAGLLTAGYSPDTPSVTDTLHRSTRDRAAMAALIASKAVSPPIAIAVFGAWGSGKSSFMEQLAEQVDSHQGKPGFVRRVRHVRFNAWHYAESELLASLLQAVWDEIGDKEVVRASVAKDAAADLAQARAERDALKARQARVVLEEAANALDESGPLKGLNLGRLADELRGTRYAWNVVRTARPHWRDLVLIVVALVLAAAGIVLTHLALPGGFAVAAAVIAALGAAVGPLRRSLARLGVVSRAVDDEMHAIDARIENLEKRRRTLRNPTVADLANELRADHALRERLGVHAIAQGQLRRLFDVVGQDPARERIVLYVDDLDRCSHERVVEVLETVHLLLAETGFVVVVAVDPRWLEASLTRKFPDMLTARADRAGLSRAHAGRAATTVEYLEKIFQIAYKIPDFRTVEDFGSFVQGLVGEQGAVDAAEPVGDGDPSAAGAAGRERGPVVGSAPQGRNEAANTLRLLGEEERGSVPLSDADLLREVADNLGEGAEADAIFTAPSAPAPRPPVEVEARALLLEPEEIALIAAVMPHLTSPRNGVRMVNIYRLVRAANDPTGKGITSARRAALVMLIAAQVAHLADARVLFDVLAVSEDAAPLAEIASGLPSGLAALVGTVVAQTEADAEPPVCADAAHWLPAVRRYAFDAPRGVPSPTRRRRSGPARAPVRRRQEPS